MRPSKPDRRRVRALVRLNEAAEPNTRWFIRYFPRSITTGRIYEVVDRRARRHHIKRPPVAGPYSR